ncbi:MAG: hypothetical protein HRU41_36135 [Saprospiraceae bacterium]|nr:hypothetical protein [Saprospiraceae bacterium]
MDNVPPILLLVRRRNNGWGAGSGPSALHRMSVFSTTIRNGQGWGLRCGSEDPTTDGRRLALWVRRRNNGWGDG